MKKLLFIFLTIFALQCYGQDKIVKIPQSELDGFFLAIDTLQQQDSLKTILISDLELQLTDYKTLSLQNDTLLLLKSDEILLLNNQINLYSDRLKIADAWYNKRWFGIVVGVVGTSTAIYLAGQISN
tara:strand:+ start:3880 stop:4260 length:381 start_codon:yes stop_codon:yes gene_type:complete